MRLAYVAGILALAGLTVLATSPVAFSYATSDSMEPTIQKGAAYLVVPTADVGAGDVITFYAAEKGAYVTHRVVRETERGYVTIGDANPSTDQAAGAPTVPRSSVVGEVLTVGGQPLTVPWIGLVASTINKHLLAIVGALGLGSVAWWRAESATTSTRASPLTIRDVVLSVMVACAIVSGAFVLSGGQHQTLTYDAAENEAVPPDGDRVIPARNAVERTYTLRLVSSSMTLSLITADGAHVVQTERRTSSTDRLFGVVPLRQQTTEVTVRMPPTDPGSRTVTVSTYAYPSVLPESVIESLHAIHPALAIAVLETVVFGPIVAAAWAFLDPARPLRACRRWERWLGS